MPRPYSHNGFAGCVQQRRNRQTGTLIGVYHGVQAGLEDDPECPWCTVCEDHGSIVSHPTLALAKAHASWPEWCSDCQLVMFPDLDPDD